MYKLIHPDVILADDGTRLVRNWHSFTLMFRSLSILAFENRYESIINIPQYDEVEPASTASQALSAMMEKVKLAGENESYQLEGDAELWLFANDMQVVQCNVRDVPSDKESGWSVGITKMKVYIQSSSVDTHSHLRFDDKDNLLWLDIRLPLASVRRIVNRLEDPLKGCYLELDCQGLFFQNEIGYGSLIAPHELFYVPVILNRARMSRLPADAERPLAAVNADPFVQLRKPFYALAFGFFVLAAAILLG